MEICSYLILVAYVGVATVWSKEVFEGISDAFDLLQFALLHFTKMEDSAIAWADLG